MKKVYRLLPIASKPMVLGVAISALSVGVLTITGYTQPVSAESTKPGIRKTVVADKLDNPRGLAFGPDGALYVVEAGLDGQATPIPGPVEGVFLNFGLNGAVTRVQNSIQERIITNLPSLTVSQNSTTSLTPSVNGSGQTFGVSDIAFNRQGNAYLVIGFATQPIYRSELGPDGMNLGTLLKFDLTLGEEVGLIKQIADFATYEANNNPDGNDFVSDPFSLLIENDDVLVTDGGANALLRVNKQGNISTEATFNARTFPNLGLGTIDSIASVLNVANPLVSPVVLVQSVPTGITVGSDGTYYVGEFTGFPFLEGIARIFSVVPGYTPEVYAEGFTQIIDLALAPNGGLYVLEYASRSLLSSDPTGALIYLSPSGERTTLMSDGLVFPTAMTTDANGAIYISNYGSYAGIGEVIKVDIEPTHIHESVPEPTSTLSLLVFGALGVCLIMNATRHSSVDKLVR